MSKILAIDFGLKRTGLAISDESKTFAFGLKTLESKLLELEINNLLKKESIEKIVIGYPLSLTLKETHITQNVIILKDRFTKLFPSIKIELYDERFTSKIASDSFIMSGISQKKAKEKSLTDEVSAIILLQDYLTFLKKN